jgi:photosystem II stability/assembly factor-like uncharacterized protein
MNESSRRRFLGVAGTGAVAAGAAVAIPSTAFAGSVRRKDSATEAVVAHISDPASGQMSLFVGEREVVVRDRDLVNRLLNAARS